MYDGHIKHNADIVTSIQEALLQSPVDYLGPAGITPCDESVGLH